MSTHVFPKFYECLCVCAGVREGLTYNVSRKAYILLEVDVYEFILFLI